jgi:predicted ATPase
LFRGEPVDAAFWAEKEIEVCRRYQLPLLLSQGAFQLGWALAEQGDPESGIERMREGLSGVAATGAEMGLPYLIALLAQAQAKAGRPDAGLIEIERALNMADANGARFQSAEIFRLKGELLLSGGSKKSRDEAEMCFRRAIALAAAQGARLPELRARVSLVRLAGRENPAESKAMAQTLAGLSEGNELADVQSARALLRRA